MEPYTAEGMARRDAEADKESDSEPQLSPDSRTEESAPMEITISVTPEAKQINYELVGVVVHSGQANAGHYYSFIKERRFVTWCFLPVVPSVRTGPLDSLIVLPVSTVDRARLALPCS